jgi:hypothetical protein
VSAVAEFHRVLRTISWKGWGTAGGMGSGIFNMGAWHCATMAMIRLRVTQHSRPHKEHTQAEAAVEKAKIEDAYLSGLINWDKKRGLNRLGTALWIRPALF